MQREDDPSHRFDYLLEPVSVADEPDDAVVPARRAPDPGRRPFAFAGMAAALGALGAAAVLVLTPHSETDPPVTPQPAPTSVATSSALPAASPSAEADAPMPSATESAPAATQAPAAPATRQNPTPSARPTSRTAPSPVVRAPISVAPESRTPPTNHNRRGDGSEGGGGILGDLTGGLLG